MFQKRRQWLVMPIVIGGLLIVNHAIGQDIPPELQQTLPDPGILLDYNRKTLESEEKEKTPPLLPAETIIDVTPSNESTDQAQESPQFYLKQVQISGVTVFDQSRIIEIIQPYVDQMVGFEELINIRDQITNLYLQNGYLTSRAFLPPQDVTNGEVFIQVVEGVIEDIEIQGLKHLKDKYIRKRLEVQPGQVFRVSDLEKDLITINRGNLVQLKANITAGETFGTSDVILTATEHNPIDLSLFVDNQGRENLGFYRSGFIYGHNNLLGSGEQLTLSGIGSLSSWGQGGTQTFFGSYSFPLGTRGTRMGVNVSAGHVDIGGPFKELDITGRSYTTGIFAVVPIWQGERFSLAWDIGFDIKTSLQFLSGVPFKDLGVPDTEVRTFHTGLTWGSTDRFGQTLIQNEITQAVDTLGGHDAFLKYNLNFTRIQSLLWGALLIGRFSGQVTPNNLVAMEQFQVGGAQSVRGYREGALIGDQGYFAGLELRVPSYFLPDTWKQNIQWLGFFEAGATGMSKLESYAGTEGNIRSVGFGVRARLSNWLSIRCDAGFSFTDNQNEPTTRVHFGIASSPF